MTNMETPQRDKQSYDQHGDPTKRQAVLLPTWRSHKETSRSMTNIETPQRDKQFYDQHGDPTKGQAVL